MHAKHLQEEAQLEGSRDAVHKEEDLLFDGPKAQERHRYQQLVVPEVRMEVRVLTGSR